AADAHDFGDSGEVRCQFAGRSFQFRFGANLGGNETERDKHDGFPHNKPFCLVKGTQDWTEKWQKYSTQSISLLRRFSHAFQNHFRNQWFAADAGRIPDEFAVPLRRIAPDGLTTFQALPHDAFRLAE